MPLIGNGDRLIGVIQVLNNKEQEVFNEADESLLGGLSAHITVALERARLIEAYVEKERVEETLKLAHDIQMSMLPWDWWSKVPMRRDGWFSSLAKPCCFTPMG
jgi:hypothetical protein